MSQPTTPVSLHPYHCVLCGNRTHEIGCGLLECLVCKEQFFPTMNEARTAYAMNWQRKEKPILEDDNIPF